MNDDREVAAFAPSPHSSVLVILRPTHRFQVLHIASLKAAAVRILQTADIVQKAHDTLLLSTAWQRGAVRDLSSESDDLIDPPEQPSRPPAYGTLTEKQQLLEWDAMDAAADCDKDDVALRKRLRTILKKKTPEYSIHGIANAEGYAMDLFWDLIARYMPRSDGRQAASDSSAVHRLPRAFYDEMVAIAAQEAEHFLSWHRRLQQLRCPFGALPCHGGLWQSAIDTKGAGAAAFEQQLLLSLLL